MTQEKQTFGQQLYNFGRESLKAGLIAGTILVGGSWLGVGINRLYDNFRNYDSESYVQTKKQIMEEDNKSSIGNLLESLPKDTSERITMQSPLE